MNKTDINDLKGLSYNILSNRLIDIENMLKSCINQIDYKYWIVEKTIYEQAINGVFL